jgi:aryl-alcohol dehydrogenase-like predicted oxidoreductase
VETRAFGKTGLQVSVLGFGGAEIGFEAAPQAEVDRLLHAAIDEGLNVIDTGECYADSEEKIGKAIASRRADFHLFTKCGHSSGFPEPDWDLGMLARTIDRSLERLQTDHLDLIQLHSCSEEMLRDGAVIEVLQKAKEAGKTRFTGYSGDRNDSVYAVSTGLFDVLQTTCNFADQQSIETSLPAAAAAGLGVIAKRPIANAAWIEPAVGAYGRPYWERLQKLQYDFLGLSSDEIASIALRFTLAQPGVATAIVGTKNPTRWKQNAAYLADGPLDPALIASIRARWEEAKSEDWVGQT